jgi:hypothetical protein
MGDSWGLAKESIGGVINYDRGIHSSGCTGACPWPDPDCFEIGNNETKINRTQSQSYFSWYAIANAPLIISTRIDTLDPALKDIFQEPEVIAINQDFENRRGLPVSSPLSHLGTIWGKPLSHKFKFFANKSATFTPLRAPPACGGSDCGA